MTLIVYDLDGKIWAIMTGTYDTPKGIPYIEVMLPEDKYPIKIDLTVVPRVPIYEDLIK